MHPVLVKIGPLVIHWYGLMIAMAIMVGLWLAGREAERKGIPKVKVQDFTLYAIIGSLVGARLYYVVFGDWAWFSENLLSVFAIWQGGLAIHGGIIGGLLVAVLYTKKQNIPFWKYADAFAPSLILGQAIGRIGCFLNGDAHGYPTNMPWGLVYSPHSPAGQMFPGRSLHPTQLYEMVFNIIIFAILWMLRKRLKTDGNLFLIYVILYSAIRIFVEHFRADKLTFLGNISAAQTLGVTGILVSFGIIIALNRRTAPIESRHNIRVPLRPKGKGHGK